MQLKLPEDFRGSWGQLRFSGFTPTFVPRFTLDAARIYQSGGLYVFNRISITGLSYPTASPHGTTYWFRNFNRTSIDYAFRPRLRYRLTLSRLTFLRKP